MVTNVRLIYIPRTYIIDANRGIVYKQARHALGISNYN